MEMSVIIPTLNEGKYLRKTLECLRKQTFDDFEIIVVDGDSKDNTRDVARKYVDKVFHLKKIGVPLARNYGAKKARGKILVHTDADCVIPQDWLEKIYDDFQKNDVDMVWGPVYFRMLIVLFLKIGLKRYMMISRKMMLIWFGVQCILMMKPQY
jgi:glycosyltransferase involved in cell wall biosynthesis